MSSKRCSARLIFGAGVLLLCWVFPTQPVFWFAVGGIGVLLLTAPDGAIIEPISRRKGLAVLAVTALLFALAGYGISLLPAFAVLYCVNLLSICAGPCVAGVVVYLECAPPAPVRNRVQGGRR